jgi:hypothetical protein
MALDFGLLNTNAPAQIAGAYGRGQQEAQANQLAQLQMRQQTASTQGAEMNLTRLKQEHDALDKLMAEITANGGPSDPMQAADMMLKSGLPEYFKRGLDMKQSYAQLNNDRVAMGLPPLSSAAAPAPAVSSNRVNEPNAAPGVEVFKVNEQPAPINALAAQAQAPVEPDKNALMMQAKAKLLSPNVGVREAGKLEMQQLLSPKEPVYHNVVGVGLVDPRTGRVVTPSVEKPPAPPTSAAEYELAKKDPNFMRFLQERAAATRAPAAPRPEPAPRTQQVTLNDGSLGIVNMDTGVITRSTVDGATVKGKPSAFAEKATAQKAQMGKDLGFAIAQLTDITKDGGLIDQSTGSGAGRLVDIGAGFVGQATKGAIAIGKIAPVADLALKMIPRFEGPQSNADTKSYKEAAGQLADPTLPTEIRKQAGRAVLRIMKERQGQFVTSDMAAEGVAPAAAAPRIAPPVGFTPDQQ